MTISVTANRINGHFFTGKVIVFKQEYERDRSKKKKKKRTIVISLAIKGMIVHALSTR